MNSVFLQFRENAWKSWEEVGIEELFDTCYHVSVVDTNTVLSMELKETITPIKLTPAELKALTPAIQMFSGPSALQKISIYIEACTT